MSENTSPKKGAAQDELLHRYVDGNLSAAEAEALKAEAGADPMMGRKVEGLLEVRGLMQEMAAASSADVDGNALFSRVEAQLETTTSAESSADISSDSIRPQPALRLVPGGGENGRSNGVPAEVRRRRLIGASIGALAVAAAAVIAFTQLWETEGPIVAEGDDPVIVPDVTPPDEEPEIADAAPARTEVLEVDFGTNVGTIFSVDGDAGQRYAVVWVDDEGNVSEAHD